MMKMKIFTLGFIVLAFCPVFAHGQSVIHGRVIDAKTFQKVTHANISVGDGVAGTSTDFNGNFSLQVEPGQSLITISSVGFMMKSLEVALAVNEEKNLGDIFIEPGIFALEEVNIISSMAQDRKTPVALSAINTTQIESQLGDQTFPEILKMVPGVYAAREGGGNGDASVNIRGFEQENVALLLNGIPISSVENGLVYWNNWLGLSDVARTIQVQRGLGASNVALNSVGGTINIVTKTTEAQKGGAISYAMTSYGNSKFSLNLNTGLLKNGVAVSFLGSRTTGPGYVDATYVDAWAYFLSVSKEFNKNHKLVFTALGAPERHGQRSLKLSTDEIDQYGIKFNKNWGSYNGEINNASENFYHKPHFTLNDYLTITDDLFLATSLYYSPGSGGGKWTEAYGYGTPTIFEYRNPSGQIDWDAIYQNNANNQDTATLANGQKVTGYSKNIQTNFLASHVWGGLLSRMEYQQTEKLKYSAGIHLRYFKSKLQEKVRDLLGGDFFIDNYAWAVDGVAGRNEIKNVGDVIKVNNGAYNPSGSLFGQVEFETGKTNVFLSGTFNNVWYQRWDEYNYVNETKSEIILKTGFDVKAGVNFNLDEKNNIYANGGYFSRAPYYKYVFGNYTNVPTKDLSNEKVQAAEIGYGYSDARTRAKANAYFTLWQDKSFLSNEYIQLENNTQTRALVTGLDALHQGIEFEIEHRFSDVLNIGGLFSAGNWKWKNNVSATLFDDNNHAVDTVNVYADGLFVGGAPQFQAGVFFGVKILKSFDLSGNWVYYDKIYANFDPSRRTNPDDNNQSFRIPAYSLLDIHFGYPFDFLNSKALFNISCYNVLNTENIIRGEDGLNHDDESFRGFWGFGRTFNFSLRLSL
jgi:outer membrane cobalamin receptor